MAVSPTRSASLFTSTSWNSSSTNVTSCSGGVSAFRYGSVMAEVQYWTDFTRFPSGV